MPRCNAKLTDDLDQVLEMIRVANRYHSKPDAIRGLIRYAALVQKPHSVTTEIAALPLAKQDAFDKGLLDQMRRGEGKLGSWFEARMEALYKRFSEEGKKPTAKDIAMDIEKGITGDAPPKV